MILWNVNRVSSYRLAEAGARKSAKIPHRGKPGITNIASATEHYSRENPAASAIVYTSLLTVQVETYKQNNKT